MSPIRLGMTNFSEGQGIVDSDLLAAQTMAQIVSGDYRFASHCWAGSRTGFTSSTDVLYGRGGVLAPTMTGLALSCGSGLVHQMTNSPNGIDWKFLSYWVDTAEIAYDASELTANVDPTLPRWALLQCKLSLVEDAPLERDIETIDPGTGIRTISTEVRNTRRYVQLEHNWRYGTPATTATIPTATVGWVPILAVMLTAADTGTGSQSRVCSLHVPLDVRAHFVPGMNMFFSNNGTEGTTAGTQGAYYSPGATALVSCYVPGVSPVSRLVGFEAFGDLAAGSNVDLCRFAQTSGTGPVMTALSSSTAYALGTSSTADRFFNLMAHTDIKYTDGVLTGGPYWGRGHRSRTVNATYDMLAIRYQLYPDSRLVGTRFYVAG
jgi:hypothetical protein